MKGGYIFLHRAILESPDFENLTFPEKWAGLVILLTAAHRRTAVIYRGDTVTLEPGELISSGRSLAAAAGVSHAVMRSAISKLESTQFLAQNSAQKKYTKIRINKWEFYQKPKKTAQNSAQKTAHEQEFKIKNNITSQKNTEDARARKIRAIAKKGSSL